MCNLSTGIEERATERATEKTSEKFILNMYKKGYTLDQIADVAETDVDEVEAIIRERACNGVTIISKINVNSCITP